MKTLHLHNSISIKQILFLWLVLCLLPGMANATGDYFSKYYDKYDSKRIGERHHRSDQWGKQCTKSCDNALTIPLLINQKTQVGVVKITYDEYNLNIKYIANDGWLIEKTHLAVADSFEGLPQDRYGNPKLRRFPHKTNHKKPVQKVNRMLSSKHWPIGTELYIAAQASVVAKNPMHHGKKRFQAKSWSGMWAKHMKITDSNNHDDNNKNIAEEDGYHDTFNDSKQAKRENSKFFFQRFFDKKQKQQKYRETNACAKGSKRYKQKKCTIKAKSAWTKGYDFPGNKDGFYFTYLLQPCKPVTNSTIQFSEPVYSANENETEAKVKVTRSGDLSETASVQFMTSDGTAIAGVDYVPVDEKITFDPDVSELEVAILLIDDSEVEDVKTVNLQLLDAQGAALGEQDTAVLEISDDDEVMPQLDSFIFEPAQYVARESDDFVILTVKRVGNLVGEATVDFAATGGSAMNGLDYELMPGTLVFMDGEDTMTITVIIREDRAMEGDETVVVSLANEVNGELGDPAEAVLIIEDNEGPN